MQSGLAEVRTYHLHYSADWKAAEEALAYMPHLHTVYLYCNPALLLPYLTRYGPQLRVLRFMADLFAEQVEETREALLAALSSLPYQELLQWRLQDSLGDAGLMALAQHCPKLRSLDCTCVEVTDAGLTALVRGCPGLRTLAVWYCRKRCATDASCRP